MCLLCVDLSRQLLYFMFFRCFEQSPVWFLYPTKTSAFLFFRSSYNDVRHSWSVRVISIWVIVSITTLQIEWSDQTHNEF